MVRKKGSSIRSFQSFDPAFTIQIVIAVVRGGVVSFARQFRGKPIGIWISILICRSTDIFVSLSTTLYGAGADLTRILG